MKHLTALLLLSLVYALPAAATALHTEAVDYRAGAAILKGYLAYDPTGEAKRPGVLVVPEWWGLNDYARGRARELAALGYVAFAVDMYGGGRSTDDPEQARQWAGEVGGDPELARARFMAAREVLQSHPRVDAKQIAAIGYCFGGTVVLNTARAGADLDGVVSFHGTLPVGPTPPQAEVTAEVLVLHGAADSFVTDTQMATFKRQMQRAGANFQIIVYPGAKHSFTNPAADETAEKFGLDVAYDPRADRRSWQDMRAFFERIFE
jgi:dienelactone hydrolase